MRSSQLRNTRSLVQSHAERRCGVRTVAINWLRYSSAIERKSFRIFAVNGQQLAGAHHPEPVGGREIALHVVLHGVVEVPVVGGVGGEEHARHGGRPAARAARASGEGEHLGHAPLAAVVGEHGPVHTAEALLGIPRGYLAAAGMARSEIRSSRTNTMYGVLWRTVRYAVSRPLRFTCTRSLVKNFVPRNPYHPQAARFRRWPRRPA